MTVAIVVYAVFAVLTAIFLTGNIKGAWETIGAERPFIFVGTVTTCLVVFSAVWPAYLLSIAFITRAIRRSEELEKK